MTKTQQNWLIKSLKYARRIITENIKDETDEVNVIDEQIESDKLPYEVWFEWDLKVKIKIKHNKDSKDNQNQNTQTKTKDKKDTNKYFKWTLIFKEPDNQFSGDEVCIWDYKDPMPEFTLLITDKLPAFVSFEDLDQSVLNELNKFLETFKEYKSIVDEDENYKIIDLYNELHKSIFQGIKKYISDQHDYFMKLINEYHENHHLTYEYVKSEIFEDEEMKKLIFDNKLSVIQQSKVK